MRRAPGARETRVTRAWDVRRGDACLMCVSYVSDARRMPASNVSHAGLMCVPCAYRVCLVLISFVFLVRMSHACVVCVPQRITPEPRPPRAQGTQVQRPWSLKVCSLLHQAPIRPSVPRKEGHIPSPSPTALLCGVVRCSVLCCSALRCSAGARVGAGVVWCGVVCRRRCYQMAMAGMVLHAGQCKPGGLCDWCVSAGPCCSALSRRPRVPCGGGGGGGLAAGHWCHCLCTVPPPRFGLRVVALWASVCAVVVGVVLISAAFLAAYVVSWAASLGGRGGWERRTNLLLLAALAGCLEGPGPGASSPFWGVPALGDNGGIGLAPQRRLRCFGLFVAAVAVFAGLILRNGYKDGIPRRTALCGAVWCGVVVWCGVPKALLPEGNGH